MTNILNLKNFNTDLGHSVIGIRCVLGPGDPCHDWYMVHVLIIYIALFLILVSDWMAGGDWDLLHIIEIIWKETEILAEMYATSVSNLLSSNFSYCEWPDGTEWFFYLLNITEVIQREIEILAVWNVWINTRKCGVLLWHGKG